MTRTNTDFPLDAKTWFRAFAYRSSSCGAGTPSADKFLEVKRRDDGKLRFRVSVFPRRGNKYTESFMNLYKFVKSSLINSCEFVRFGKFRSRQPLSCDESGGIFLIKN